MKPSRYTQTGVFTVSRDAFRSIQTGYPHGAYAEYAEIKVADSFFELRNYKEAALLYEDFLTHHPSSQSTPYVLYQAARSNRMIHRGVGRDVGGA